MPYKYDWLPFQSLLISIIALSIHPIIEQWEVRDVSWKPRTPVDRTSNTVYISKCLSHILIEASQLILL